MFALVFWLNDQQLYSVVDAEDIALDPNSGEFILEGKVYRVKWRERKGRKRSGVVRCRGEIHFRYVSWHKGTFI